MNFKLNNSDNDGVEVITDKGLSRRRFLMALQVLAQGF